ncbi:hypothetical protein EMIT013CA1_150042 [Bacillus sp. IT-13CA1]
MPVRRRKEPSSRSGEKGSFFVEKVFLPIGKTELTGSFVLNKAQSTNFLADFAFFL